LLLIIAAISLPLYLFVFYEANFLNHIFGFICLINAFLATFNLLPFGPLDGMKIIRWNATIWIIMLIVSISILVLIFPESQKFF
jgi:Zn-dependent protease